MDYKDPVICCLKKAFKLNRSHTHSKRIEQSFANLIEWNPDSTLISKWICNESYGSKAAKGFLH